MKLVFDTSNEVRKIEKICAAIHDEGGRAFLVGGVVRDLVMAELGITTFANAEALSARDFDIEAYHLNAEQLRQLLTRFGRVDAVGEAFTVYKIALGHDDKRIEVDVSL